MDDTRKSYEDGKSSEEAYNGERFVMLACSDCGEDRPHRVRYRQETMAEMHCTACGRTIVLNRMPWKKGGRGDGAASTSDPSRSGRRRRRVKAPRVVRTLGAAAFGLSVRAATKPVRLWRQVRREGVGAVRTMPVRAATKPLRLVRELRRGMGKGTGELS